ncbi:hypothetical protein V1504DRAFT_501085 [Lipomyces starkeyi]
MWHLSNCPEKVDELRLIKAPSTMRLNIAYDVTHVPANELRDNLRATIISFFTTCQSTDRALVFLRITTGYFPRDGDGVLRNASFVSLCATVRQFNGLLVSDRAELADVVVSVQPHPLMPMPSVHRAQREIYGEPDWQPDDMEAVARQFQPDARLDRGPRRVDAGAADLIRRLDRDSTAGYNMVDEDETLVLDCGVRVFARDVGDGQGVFCPVCETQVDKSRGRDGKWIVAAGIGEASAVAMERETGQVVLYCFNCSVLNVVIQCSGQYGFVAEGDEIVQLGAESKKINWRGRPDITFDGNYRLFFLDAPMGTGKTHAVREYLRQNPTLRVISITFRQALARYLSNEFGVKCYLDKDFWEPAGDRSRSLLNSFLSVSYWSRLLTVRDRRTGDRRTVGDLRRNGYSDTLTRSPALPLFRPSISL